MGFLLFILYPIAEIYVFSELVDHIGGFNTFLFVVGSAFVGFSLLRSAGMNNLARMQEQMSKGAPQTSETWQPLYRIASGALFIVPGVITDVLAILLLFPPTQFVFQKLFVNYFKSKMASGNFRVQTFTSGFGEPPRQSNMRDVTPARPEVIDVSPNKKS